jgi:predicted patatin/cPLA2 family phospholipase
MLNKNIKRENLINSGRVFLSGVHSMKENRFLTFRESDPEILKGILASASIPGIFPVVKIRNDTFIDGGVSYMTPVKSAILECVKLNATEIYVDVINAVGDLDLPNWNDREMVKKIYLK